MLATESRGDGTFLEGIVDGVTVFHAISYLLRNPRPNVNERMLTYGGRKNCSSTTYMPRKISVSKK
jgi:hypothetical protein